jgi:hypothetical protein
VSRDVRFEEGRDFRRSLESVLRMMQRHSLMFQREKSLRCLVHQFQGDIDPDYFRHEMRAEI